MTRIEAVIDFLKNRFPYGIQIFTTRNILGDSIYPTYEEDGISIEYCPNWYYVEIFGLTSNEWQTLIQSGEWEAWIDKMKKWY